MKFAILAIMALTSSYAVAGALDVKDPYEGKPYISNPNTACVDGQTQIFTEARGNDRFVNVLRTCVNGRYYPKSVTKGAACKEGTVAFWSVAREGLDRYDTVKFVCVNGKYIAQ